MIEDIEAPQRRGRISYHGPAVSEARLAPTAYTVGGIMTGAPSPAPGRSDRYTRCSCGRSRLSGLSGCPHWLDTVYRNLDIPETAVLESAGPFTENEMSRLREIGSQKIAGLIGMHVDSVRYIIANRRPTTPDRLRQIRSLLEHQS